MIVFCEKYVFYEYNNKIKFQATIDRLEIDNKNKTIYIYDPKQTQQLQIIIWN